MTVGIIANLEKRAVKKIIPEVIAWLKKRGVDFVVEEKLAEHLNLPRHAFPRSEGKSLCRKCQMVISFGGDGTILSSARLVGRSGTPILGVKMGGMGFLAELAPDEIYTSLEDILNGRYQTMDRMVLEARFENDDGTERFHAVNDFVLDKGAISRVIRLKTFIDDEFLNSYIGDGVIVSTPTGSTAYSLAAGGPILIPGMDAVVINPISPHSLGARPVVIPGDKTVRVQIEEGPQEVMFSADGQIRMMLHQGQHVEIRKADYTIKLVSYKGRSFYDILRAKLHWGEDVREDNRHSEPH
ncbi:MAG: NAD(+)/NADH kinase [bacterium]